jgi:hypothetical protein
MSAGFYKRHRWIVQRIDCGEIDLLDSGILDYLCLKANLIIGNGYKLPAGVVLSSAPALQVRYKRVSVRTIERHLKKLEKLGLLKFSCWWKCGRRGDYPVVICGAPVHDMSGNEYRVNCEKTGDWRDPVYEPVGELSASW